MRELPTKGLMVRSTQVRPGVRVDTVRRIKQSYAVMMEREDSDEPEMLIEERNVSSIKYAFERHLVDVLGRGDKVKQMGFDYLDGAYVFGGRLVAKKLDPETRFITLIYRNGEEFYAGQARSYEKANENHEAALMGA